VRQNYSSIMEKSKIIKEDGFIAIIALSIFLLLSLFGIIVQRVTTDSLYNVATTNKYNEASDIADSVIEYLQYEMSKREAGFNMEEVICDYDGTGGQTSNSICNNVDVPLGIGDKEMTITMEVKGRNEDGDALSGQCPGMFLTIDECYITPIPGTGDAGERCDLYDPKAQNQIDAIIDHNGESYPQGTANVDGIAQIDYSCNWNKLSYGSSSTDRVTIPLYYDISLPGDPESIIINPFHEDTTDLQYKATEFVVRVRPPCLPCGTETGQRQCDAGDDKTICEADPNILPSERYRLNTLDGNDIVVQWQISGICDEEPCSYIQNVNYIQNSDEIREVYSSVISEERINGDVPSLPQNVSLFASGGDLGGEGLSTTTYQEEYINYFGTGFLKTMEKPVLTLFLSEKLISEYDENVPYLEYQILSDMPIGSPKIEAATIINIDGYLFEKTLVEEEKTSIIDFAVQN
jgi:hypothetical protein